MPVIDPALRETVLTNALNDMSVLRTCTLITYPVGEEFPRLRGMGFVHEGWTVYLSTKRVWQKAHEIAGNSKVTVLFNDTTRRKDHFIQIDGYAVAVAGDEFDQWQERRFLKEGDKLRKAAAGMAREDWAGWRIEPVRVRINGYVTGGPFSEAPVVTSRAKLGLAPLLETAQ